jgi:hypothetical protein
MYFVSFVAMIFKPTASTERGFVFVSKHVFVRNTFSSSHLPCPFYTGFGPNFCFTVPFIPIDGLLIKLCNNDMQPEPDLRGIGGGGLSGAPST